MTNGHPMCRDTSAPQVSLLTQCIAYNGSPHCCPLGDSFVTRIRNTASSLPTPPSQSCIEMLQSISCATCDPWSAHLYGVEDRSSPDRTTPRLCLPQCQQLFMTCGYDTLSMLRDWSIIPFSDSMDSFCAAHSSDAYCYNNAPYQIAAASNNSDAAAVIQMAVGGGDVSQLCLEKVLDDVYSETSRWITIVDYHDVEADIVLMGRQTGEIHAFQSGGANNQLTDLGVFLDVSNIIVATGERGLLGIALHPDFRENRRLFLSVSCRAGAQEYARQCNADGDSAILEYSLPQTASSINDIVAGRSRPTFQQLILSVPQPFANHNGGQILFSTSIFDKNMFIFLGDGGAGGDPSGFAQDMTSLLGKVLRINVDGDKPYVIPDDNPFVNRGGNVRGEIFALGLRNPWRNSFDYYQPSHIFTGDVGQDLYEEIDLIRPGANYGWNRREGRYAYDGGSMSNDFTEPIADYSHESIGRGGAGSVTGGYVYRGTEDACLHGQYVFADLYNALFVAKQTNPNVAAAWDARRVTWTCSNNSPLPCTTDLDELYTFGQINGEKTDLLLSTARGVYRVVNPERCGRTNCPAPQIVDLRRGSLDYSNPNSPRTNQADLTGPCSIVSILIASILLVLRA